MTIKHANTSDTLGVGDSSRVIWGLWLDTYGHTIQVKTKNDPLPDGSNRYEVLSWYDDGINLTWQPGWVKAHA